MPSRAIVHGKFPIKIYVINNYYLLVKKLDFILGIGFVGLFPYLVYFHAVGGLPQVIKQFQVIKMEPETTAENSVLNIFLS